MQSCESLISNLQAVLCVTRQDTPVLVVMIQHSPGHLDVVALLVLAIKLLSCTLEDYWLGWSHAEPSNL
jgi:hypothetical protein